MGWQRFLASSDHRRCCLMQQQFYAYAHLRPDGSPFYIGKGHGKRSHSFVGRNKHHQNVVAKYGAENILVEIMPCRSEAEAFLREQLIIKSLRATGASLCNKTDGGEGSSGFKHSVESLVKISVNSQAMWDDPILRVKLIAATTGRKLSEDHKAAIAKGGMGHKGCVHTEEFKIANGLRKRGNTYRRGSTHTEETRAKMSESHTGVKLSAERCAAISARLQGNQYTLGYKQSAETCAKQSLRMMGNKNNLGNKASDETKLRMITAQKLRRLREKST